MKVSAKVWSYWFPDDRVGPDEQEEYNVQHLYIVPGEAEPESVFGGLFLPEGKFYGDNRGTVDIDVEGRWRVTGEHTEHGAQEYTVNDASDATGAIETAEDEHYGFSGEYALFEMSGTPSAFDVSVPDLDEDGLEVRVVAFAPDRAALEDWVFAHRSVLGISKSAGRVAPEVALSSNSREAAV